MPDMISNTSCLIVLDNIGMITVLKDLYGYITITEEVSTEFGKDLPKWIMIEKVSDQKCLKILNSMVDTGEASTLALSTEKDGSIMILDDLKARKLAKRLDMKFTGTNGILMKASSLGIIEDMNIIIEKLRKSGFRLPTDIEQKILNSNL